MKRLNSKLFYVVLDDDETYTMDGYIVLYDWITETQRHALEAGEYIFKYEDGIAKLPIDVMIQTLEDAGLWDTLVDECEAEAGATKVPSEWAGFFKEFPEISTKIKVVNNHSFLEVYFMDDGIPSFQINVIDFTQTSLATSWHVRIGMELQKRRIGMKIQKRREGAQE